MRGRSRHQEEAHSGPDLRESLRKWFHDSEEICEHDYPEERDWPCGIMRDHFVYDFGLDAARSAADEPPLDVERLRQAIIDEDHAHPGKGWVEAVAQRYDASAKPQGGSDGE